MLSAAKEKEKMFRSKLGDQHEVSDYTASLQKSTIQQEILIEKLRKECLRLDGKIEKGIEDSQKFQIEELSEQARQKEKRNYEMIQKINLLKTKLLA